MCLRNMVIGMLRNIPTGHSPSWLGARQVGRRDKMAFGFWKLQCLILKETTADYQLVCQDEDLRSVPPRAMKYGTFGGGHLMTGPKGKRREPNNEKETEIALPNLEYCKGVTPEAAYSSWLLHPRGT